MIPVTLALDKLRTLANMPLLVWFFVIQTFLLFNAPAVFGDVGAPIAKEMIIMYLLLTLGFYYIGSTCLKGPNAVKLAEFLNMPTSMALKSFGASFFIFLAFFATVKLPSTGSFFANYLSVAGELPVINQVAFMVLFAFVISYSEELIFRGVLPMFTGDMISNVIFSVFHFWAYGGGVVALAFAFAMGMLFSMLRTRFNLNIAMGGHTAWNLAKLGAV